MSTPLFLDDDRGEEEIRWLARQAAAWAARILRLAVSEAGRFNSEPGALNNGHD
jgi:hypothetical protein